MESRGSKRQLVAMEMIYRFRILLPNGMTVGLRLTDPGSEILFDDFIKLVKEEYLLAQRQSESKRNRPVNWNGGNLYLEDANDNKIRRRIYFANFKPHKCHILRLHDGSKMTIDIYENMWDLTPDTDLLRELPEEYTFETALADLIDNSLQAVWSNGKNDRRLISVDFMKLEDKISIFDTGPGMDNSDENSIVKWGKLGASLHRSSKTRAIGGKPPYLMPYFGMFGYGGPMASMHLGRCALVSSKTKESRKVYTLHLEREAMLSSTHSELTWRVLEFFRGLRSSREANARLKCVYFPVVEGKESIEEILEKLEAEGCGIQEKFETFARVSIRRLGRLLPDARWMSLPFMESRQKKGDKAYLLKRCSLRVKCYVETDAGFNPTPSKTDLAHYNPFTTALKNFGSKMFEKEKETNVEISRNGKLLTPLQLEKEYQDWILQMHECYDEEVGYGEDDPVLIVSPTNKRDLGISSDGRDARMICRPLDVGDEDGCVLELNNGTISLEIRRSLSLPFSIVDSGKCLVIERNEWDKQLEKRRLRAPSTIDLLGTKHCQELEVDGALPFDATIDVGQVPPLEIVAVIRPASYVASSTSNSLDQKYIFKDVSEMSMEVGSICKECEKNVVVRASSKFAKWKLLSNNGSQPYIVRVGSTFRPLAIGCFDKYDNQIPFVSLPGVRVTLKLHDGLHAQIDKVKTSLSSDKLTLKVMDLLIEITPGHLDHVILQSPLPENQLFTGLVVKELVLEMFDVYGNHVAKDIGVQLNADGFDILDQTGPFRKSLMNADDTCERNKTCKNPFTSTSTGVRQWRGLFHLSIFKDFFWATSAQWSTVVSISVSSFNKVVFKQEFQIGKRELRIASKVPEYLTAGSLLENLVFEVVNSEGDVDKTIHESHTLTIKSDSFKSEDCVCYAFRHGRCTVPVVPLPAIEGNYCLDVAHTFYPELRLSFNVSVLEARNVEYDEVQSPCSHGKLLLLQDSSLQKNVGNTASFDNAGNLMQSIVNLEKGLEEEIFKYGERIGFCENQLKELNELKADHEQGLSELEASTELQLFNNVNYLSAKEEITEQIKSKSHSAAATLCHLSRNFSFQETQKLFMQDIFGLVALLGTVCSSKLSRILAEYLGEDQMLAIVCGSYEAASSLEKYKENGEVDSNVAFHAEAASLGKSISGRFLVICLEDIRAYKGEVDESDPQRKLVLPDPLLRNGNTASGFIGYAVNMINLDIYHSCIRTRSGNGLRETLFYRLFGELQVYETREHMVRARASIERGAVSLDGGILRENGIISLGCGNPEICFPVEMLDDAMDCSPVSLEIKKKIEEKKRDLQKIVSQIEKWNRMHDKAMKKFTKKRNRYMKFIDLMEPGLEDHNRSNMNSGDIFRRLPLLSEGREYNAALYNKAPWNLDY
ncbi:hypothetical protein GH714_036024 [Hevea brasiliensis]|uniref:Uncharacterized protein n=1 Tax=Hevea brasiliensis TaxID=3981 RepID=A0A6A6KV19_HEVBR|nr:hypothetical protein GH714_036024 [Hevea brasiliensis]